MQAIKDSTFVLPFLAVTLLVTLLIGCGTMKAYEGDQLPADQTAKILPYDGGGLGGLAGRTGDFIPKSLVTSISRVDGKSAAFNSNVEVLPGWHSVKFSFLNYSGIPVFDTISFCAEAGHEYFVCRRGQKIWVEDADTREVVTGSRP